MVIKHRLTYNFNVRTNNDYHAKKNYRFSCWVVSDKRKNEINKRRAIFDCPLKWLACIASHRITDCTLLYCALCIANGNVTTRFSSSHITFVDRTHINFEKFSINFVALHCFVSRTQLFLINYIIHVFVWLNNWIFVSSTC